MFCTVEQKEISCQVSAEFKLLHGIFVPVAHRFLNAKLNAMECVSFIADLDSLSLSPENFTIVASALLPFFQTDEGTVAARVLLESNSQLNARPAHVEDFFSCLMLQLFSLPKCIDISVSTMTLADVGGDSDCVLIDAFGGCIASFSFKNKSGSPLLNYGNYRTLSVEVRVGKEKPSSHVVYSGTAAHFPPLECSLKFEQQGVCVVVNSVPICFVSASCGALASFKLVCSKSISVKLQEHDGASSSSCALPGWLRYFFKSKLHQQSEDSSPLGGFSLGTILKCSERVSRLLDKVLPSKHIMGLSSWLNHSLLTELVRKYTLGFFVE
jgi:hypothetical protein